MEILRTGLKTLLGEKCFTSLWDNLDYGDLACLKLVISKGLGLGSPSFRFLGLGSH